MRFITTTKNILQTQRFSIAFHFPMADVVASNFKANAFEGRKMGALMFDLDL
jgi:hypothetical protein